MESSYRPVVSGGFITARDLKALVKQSYGTALGYAKPEDTVFSAKEESAFYALAMLANGASYDKPSMFFDILADAAMFAASTLKKENL